MYKGFVYLLTVFTLLPLPPHQQASDEEKGNGLLLLPFLAILLAFVLTLCGRFLAPVSPYLAAVCILGLDFALTGGKRYSALQKTFAALQAGRSREEKMAAMWYGAKKNSGFAAAALAMLVSYLAYLFLLANGLLTAALPAGVVFSYWLITWLIKALPLKAHLGLWQPFEQYFNKKGLIFTSVVSFLVILLCAGRPGLLAAAFAMVVVFILARRLACLFGGLSGESCLCLCQWGEDIFLLAYLLLCTLLGVF